MSENQAQEEIAVAATTVMIDTKTVMKEAAAGTPTVEEAKPMTDEERLAEIKRNMKA